MKAETGWESRIGRRLRLRDLHFLFAVVQSGSMAKAASYLGVSQPVVSEAIADLEAAVGVRLLDRTRRGVTPTLYGETLLSRSQIAFDELKQGIRDIESLANPAIGEIRIGCSESLIAGVLAPIINEFSCRFPRIKFQVASVNTLNPRLEFPDLRERKLDVVFARVVENIAEVEYAEDLEVERLVDDRLCVVVGTSSPWAARRKVDLVDLADEPWILPGNSWNSARIAEAFAAIGTKMPEVIIDTFSQALRNQLLASGRFVAAIPALTLRSDIQTQLLKVLPVALPNRPWPVAMVILKDRTLSSAAQKFVSFARTSVQAPAQTKTRTTLRKGK